MNDQTEQDQTNANAQVSAAEAVEQGIDISETVRDITLQALSKGKLDTDKIRGVVRAVLSGAREGADKQSGESSTERLRAALSGVDEALANSVQASRLAIEEAAGQVNELGSGEFKRALEELRALESLFLGAVKETAASSEQRIKQTLNDFVDHAKISGTAVGNAATESASLLTRQLGDLLKETATEGANRVLQVSSRLSQVAAGFLEGIAGSLNERSGRGDKTVDRNDPE